MLYSLFLTELLGPTNLVCSKATPLPSSRTFPCPPVHRKRNTAYKPVGKLQGPPRRGTCTPTKPRKKVTAKSKFINDTKLHTCTVNVINI